MTTDRYPTAVFAFVLLALVAGLVCGLQYTYGSVVTLTATANTVSLFLGWGGDVVGVTSPTTVTLDSDKSVIASFTPNLYLPLIQR